MRVHGCYICLDFIAIGNESWVVKEELPGKEGKVVPIEFLGVT